MFLSTSRLAYALVRFSMVKMYCSGMGFTLAEPANTVNPGSFGLGELATVRINNDELQTGSEGGSHGQRNAAHGRRAHASGDRGDAAATSGGDHSRGISLGGGVAVAGGQSRRSPGPDSYVQHY